MYEVKQMEIIKIDMEQLIFSKHIRYLRRIFGSIRGESQYTVIEDKNGDCLYIHKGADNDLHLLVKTGFFSYTQIDIPLHEKQKLIDVIKLIK